MKTNFLPYLVLLFITQNFYSQNANDKILVAKYSLYPYSTEFFNHDSDTPSDEKSFDIALRRTKEFKYTLLSNFRSDKAVFYLDSIITRPVKGKESYWIEPENVIHFAYINNGNYNKKESIFDINFYVTTTNEFSYEWEITNESKIIAGFNCIKAISKVRGNNITVWFTNDIPINYGPFNLNGLPGLILEAETFFNTITIESIKYSDNTNLLDIKIDEIERIYNSESEDNKIKEPILMLKKAQLIGQLKMMR